MTTPTTSIRSTAPARERVEFAVGFGSADMLAFQTGDAYIISNAGNEQAHPSGMPPFRFTGASAAVIELHKATTILDRMS
jgi:hypothetical protein